MYIKKSVLIICSIILIIVTAVVSIGIVNPFGFTNILPFVRFSLVSKMVDGNFYEDVSPDEYADMSLMGLTAATGDPYTNYYYGDLAEEYTSGLTGNYVGIGVYIEADTSDNTIRVVSAITGTPAEEAGITMGDKILKVDGEPFTGDKLTQAAAKIKGMDSSAVTLEIKKALSGEVVTLEVERRDIKLETVTSKMVSDDIGKISISQFMEDTGEDFIHQYGDLKLKGMKKLIIDLRNNPGGLLDQAVKIANVFIDDGEVIVYTMNKKGERKNYNAVGGYEDIPIVILTNGGSASASEVLSGALRDCSGATLIGEKTFGKGIVQSVYNIGADRILSVTTASYYTPNGVCVHKNGLTPDKEVIMDPDKYVKLSELNDKDDAQLIAAIEHLKQ